VSTVSSSVSVIVPCFNQGPTLGAALESVLKQTYTAWECIVIDDGSTDETRLVAEGYASRDTRIRYLFKPNGGLSSARNMGIDVSRGEFLQFLDADDTIFPAKFAKQIESLAWTRAAALSISDFEYRAGGSTFLTALSTPRFKSTNMLMELIDRWEEDLTIPVHAFIFKRTLFETPRIRFDEALPNHEDWDCWLRIFASSIDVAFVHEVLATYWLNPGSMARNPVRMWRGLKMVTGKQIRLHSRDEMISGALRRKTDRMRATYYTRILKYALKRAFPRFAAIYATFSP
jgi:glycosyltransferase involved in cell wall biosynthesis